MRKRMERYFVNWDCPSCHCGINCWNSYTFFPTPVILTTRNGTSRWVSVLTRWCFICLSYWTLSALASELTRMAFLHPGHIWKCFLRCRSVNVCFAVPCLIFGCRNCAQPWWLPGHLSTYMMLVFLTRGGNRNPAPIGPALRGLVSILVMLSYSGDMLWENWKVIRK